jgi:type I restriction enzyme S subunit
VPVLRISNIETGFLDLTDLKYGDLTESERDRFSLREGDCLICRTNGSLDRLGTAAIQPQIHGPLAFASYLIRIRLQTDRIAPEYYRICLSSSAGRSHIRRNARSTAGQFNLNLDALESMQIPLPPIPVQREIISRMRSLTRSADLAEKKIALTSVRCDAMEKAVLAKAFRGGLTAAVRSEPESKRWPVPDKRLSLKHLVNFSQD